MILKTVAEALSPRGENARLSILIFHRVLPLVDPLFPGEQHAARFDAVLSWVGQWFQVLPLDEAIVHFSTSLRLKADPTVEKNLQRAQADRARKAVP